MVPRAAIMAALCVSDSESQPHLECILERLSCIFDVIQVFKYYSSGKLLAVSPEEDAVCSKGIIDIV